MEMSREPSTGRNKIHDVSIIEKITIEIVVKYLFQSLIGFRDHFL